MEDKRKIIGGIVFGAVMLVCVFIAALWDDICALVGKFDVRGIISEKFIAEACFWGLVASMACVFIPAFMTRRDGTINPDHVRAVCIIGIIIASCTILLGFIRGIYF